MMIFKVLEWTCMTQSKPCRDEQSAFLGHSKPRVLQIGAPQTSIPLIPEKKRPVKMDKFDPFLKLQHKIKRI
jgi:hypothetical protein